MKVAFCLDDNKKYLPLLKVAARSLREIEGHRVDPVCVYAGQDQEIIDTIRQEKVEYIPYAPRLNRQTLPKAVWYAIGCFLKLELALVPDLADEAKILYCDADVLFRKPLASLFAEDPPYMGMAREQTAPFYTASQSLSYHYKGHEYKVPLPFPIWTFSSGVALFNLEKLRKHGLIEHFMAFSEENAEKAGNLDQSLLNYYFGKKITRLPDIWNSPPYMADSLEKGHIVHFHGPKPWQTANKNLADLRVNHFDALRQVWMDYLTPQERAALPQN